MSIVLVWILVIGAFSDHSSNVMSPPMADLESCQLVQASLKVVNRLGNRPSQCVQIKMVVSK